MNYYFQVTKFVESAQVLLINTLSILLDFCQMLAFSYLIDFNPGNDLLPERWNTIQHRDSAFRLIPCTIWAAESIAILWLIQHGFGLLEELHTGILKYILSKKFYAVEKVFEEKTGKTLLCCKYNTILAFSGPDEFKYDTSIDTLTAYKRYISSKPWVSSNYLRDPSKKKLKMKEFDYDLDYKKLDFTDTETRELYRIGRGEQGVLLVRPYTNIICNHWRFKTP